MPIQRYFVAIVLTMSGVAIAQPPTSTSLIEAVPRLFNGAEDLRSFSLRCECGTKDGIPVVFDIAWKAPNEYSLLIRDVESSTPVAFFSNDGFLIYDVSRHSLIAGNGIRPSFELFSHEHSKLKLNFSLSRVEKDETSAEFDVNLTSFLRDLDGETDISTDGDVTTLAYESRSEGADFEWNFCQASPPRLELFTIVKKQNGSNILRISKLSQNKDECVPYPNVAQLEPLITVSRVTAPSIPETFELVTDLFRAIGGHAALANAKYRSLKTFADIEDWDRISEQSKEVSSRLSAILKEPAADVHTDGHVAR